MAISVVQRATGKDDTATGTVSAAFGSSVTAGNAIIVIVVGADNTDSLFQSDYGVPTDTRTNSYQEVFYDFSRVVTTGIKAWIAYGTTGGANTVSAGDSLDECAMFIYEVSGLASSNAFDIAATQTQAATSALSSSSVTTSHANSLLIGVFGLQHTTAKTFTAGTGYSNIQQQTTSTSINAAAEEQIVSSIASYSATATASAADDPAVSVMLVFSDTATTAARVYPLGIGIDTNSGTHTLVANVKSGATALVVTYASGNTATTTPTDNHTDGNGTYTLIASAVKAASADVMNIYARTANFGSNRQITFTHAPGTSTGGGVEAFMLLNLSKTGSAVIKQSATQINHASGTPAPVFSSTPVITNPVITAGFWATNTTVAPASRSGYYEFGHANYGTPAEAVDTYFTHQGETSATITWGGAVTTAFSSLAVEIDASSSGTLFNQSVSGGLSFTGSFSKQLNRPLTGGLSFSGSISKRINKSLTAGLSFVGNVVKQLNRNLTGVLSFTGAIVTVHVFTKALTASLSFVGSISRQTNKPFSAGLSFVGGINRLVSKSLTGGLSFSGSVLRSVPKVLTASLSFTGALSRRTGKSLTGGLSFTGSISRQVNKVLTAALSFTGSIKRLTSKTLTAAGLSFTGGLTQIKAVSKVLTASLSFTGSITKQPRKVLSGGLSFSGALAKGSAFFRNFTATLTFTGTINPAKLVWTRIVTTIFSGFTKTTDASGSSVAEAAGGDTISSVQSGTKNETIDSGTKNTTIASGGTEEEL